MANDELLDKVFASDWLLEKMAWLLDFDVSGAPDGSGFQLRPSTETQPIAQDGTGGVFVLCGPGTGEDRPVLFVSSEGQAALIATTLAEAMQLIIALPYWRDCLKFSGGGRLMEMQRVVPYLEQEMRENEPDIDKLREALFLGLGLAAPVDALEKLHGCVSTSSSRLQVFSQDGVEFDGMFGGFAVQDNPMWSGSSSGR